MLLSLPEQFDYVFDKIYTLHSLSVSWEPRAIVDRVAAIIQYFNRLTIILNSIFVADVGDVQMQSQVLLRCLKMQHEKRPTHSRVRHCGHGMRVRFFKYSHAQQNIVPWRPGPNRKADFENMSEFRVPKNTTDGLRYADAPSLIPPYSSENLPPSFFPIYYSQPILLLFLPSSFSRGQPPSKWQCLAHQTRQRKMRLMALMERGINTMGLTNFSKRT